MTMQMYEQAAFCYEEAVLMRPQSAPLHVKLGEALYTAGGAERVQVGGDEHTHTHTIWV